MDCCSDFIAICNWGFVSIPVDNSFLLRDYALHFGPFGARYLTFSTRTVASQCRLCYYTFDKVKRSRTVYCRAVCELDGYFRHSCDHSTQIYECFSWFHSPIQPEARTNLFNTILSIWGVFMKAPKISYVLICSTYYLIHFPLVCPQEETQCCTWVGIQLVTYDVSQNSLNYNT